MSRLEVYFVEYDGDPHFTDRSSHVEPVRTYDSRIRSFGFKVRFSSDLTVINGKEELDRSSLVSNSLNVSVLSGENYSESDNLDNAVDSMVSGTSTAFKFAKMPGLAYQLTAFRPVLIPDAGHKPREKADMRDYNIYVHHDKKRHADTLITCINVNRSTAPCTMRFLMPPPMSAYIKVQFPIVVLKDWKNVQKNVFQVVRSFSVYSSKIEK